MSLLTGTFPSRHGIDKDWTSIKNKKYPKLNESIKNIAEVLKSYNINIKTLKFARLPNELGFGRGYDKNYIIDSFHSNKLINKVLKELENNKKENFFLFIHTWMVHAPYANTYFLEKGKIGKKKRRFIGNFRKLGNKIEKTSSYFRSFLKKNNLFNVDFCMTLYDSGIHYVDQCIGIIINKSKQLGIYDDLMFIVVSDHGEHFEEHFPNKFYDYHGKDFYEEFIKVPLIIKYPHTFKGKMIDHHVSLIDVLPTILNYYKLKIPSFVQGESLLKPYLNKNRKYIVSEAISLPNLERKMIRVGHLKYIITMKEPFKPGRINWNSIIMRRLYDLKEDPLEQNNLYKDLKFRRICIDFEKTLLKIINNSAKTNRSGKETKLDDETLGQMEALGYL